MIFKVSLHHFPSPSVSHCSPWFFPFLARGAPGLDLAPQPFLDLEALPFPFPDNYSWGLLSRRWGPKGRSLGLEA